MWGKYNAIMLRNCYTEGLYAEGTDKMKKLFNHTKRPERNWEEDVQDGVSSRIAEAFGHAAFICAVD